MQLQGHLEVARTSQAVATARVTSVFPDRRRTVTRLDESSERRSPHSRTARGHWVARGEITLPAATAAPLLADPHGVARLRADDLDFDLVALKPVEGGEGELFAFVALCDPTPDQLARLPREPGMAAYLPGRLSQREERMVAMLRLLREGVGRRELTWELAQRIPDERAGQHTTVSTALVKNDLSMSLNWILRGVRVGRRPSGLPDDLWPPDRVRSAVQPLILKKPSHARRLILDWLMTEER